MKNTKSATAQKIVISVINPAVWIMAIVMGVIGMCVFFVETFKENPFNQFLLWGTADETPETPEPEPEPVTRKPITTDCNCELCTAKREGRPANIPGWLKPVQTVSLEECIEKEKQAAKDGNMDQAIFWRDIQKKFKPGVDPS